ncbi:hypothetical protein B0H15DRAFT_799411 [Mycena belliarum]|uniref:Uncharacterized protein n=1 Tax=Mycena belliarum TaxID=1033014 RepID=A0AAD6UCG4_9AGAR|nr:hypothetical protein B0H15DRAFT_799411 [Mycena belliae]
MPVLNTTIVASSATDSASTTASAASNVSIAGHVYTPAQLHHFLRGATLILAFALFSYLALVTVPRLAARRTKMARSLPQTANDTMGSQQQRTRTSLATPEHPFAPRLCRTSAAAGTAHRTSAGAHPTQVPRKFTPGPPPTHWRAAPSTWASAERLHAHADALIGAHPAAVPLAARHLPARVQPSIFPWIPTRRPTVGVPPGHPSGLPPLRPRAKTLPTQIQSGKLDSTTRPSAQLKPRQRIDSVLLAMSRNGAPANNKTPPTATKKRRDSGPEEERGLAAAKGLPATAPARTLGKENMNSRGTTKVTEKKRIRV